MPRYSERRTWRLSSGRGRRVEQYGGCVGGPGIRGVEEYCTIEMMRSLRESVHELSLWDQKGGRCGTTRNCLFNTTVRSIWPHRVSFDP